MDLGSIADFPTGLGTGSAAVNTGSEIVDGAADIFGDILVTIGSFISSIVDS